MKLPGVIDPPPQFDKYGCRMDASWLIQYEMQRERKKTRRYLDRLKNQELNLLAEFRLRPRT